MAWTKVPLTAPLVSDKYGQARFGKSRYGHQASVWTKNARNSASQTKVVKPTSSWTKIAK